MDYLLVTTRIWSKRLICLAPSASIASLLINIPRWSPSGAGLATERSQNNPAGDSRIGGTHGSAALKATFSQRGICL